MSRPFVSSGLAFLTALALVACDGEDPGKRRAAPPDEEARTITPWPAGALTTSEKGAGVTVTLTPCTPPTADVTVTVAVEDETEGRVSQTSVVFPAGDGKPLDFALDGVDDALDDGDVSYTVSFTVSSEDATFDGLAVPPVTVTNLDDDAAGVAFDAPSPRTHELRISTEVSVRLTSEPLSDVVVRLVSTDVTEGAPSVEALTFTSANWQTPQPVTVTGLPDLELDGDVAYSLEARFETTEPSYAELAPAALSLVNEDFVVRDLGTTYSDGVGVAGGQVVFYSVEAGDLGVLFDLTKLSSRVLPHDTKDPRLSADGRFLVFRSWAESAREDRLALYELATDLRTDLGSADLAEGDPDGLADVSRDGRFVVFQTPARVIPALWNGKKQIYLRNTAAPSQVTMLSATAGGLPGAGDSDRPRISEDGKTVVFESLAPDLADDTDGTKDVFVWREGSGLQRLTHSGPLDNGLGDSLRPAIDGSGTTVFFSSNSSALVVGDENWVQDVFRHDLTTGTTELVSVPEPGGAAGYSDYAAASRDGSHTAFASYGTLISGDTNARKEVYVSRRAPHRLRRVPRLADASEQVGSDCFAPELSPDASLLAMVCADTQTNEHHVYAVELDWGFWASPMTSF